MATRVSSSRLIGRVAELGELEAALADAEAGRPSVAFVAGESGVGKSRLVAELERRAEERGALVLAGDCVDIGESELPYVPLVAALRPLARSGDPALTPELRAAVAPLLPGTAPAADPPEPDAGAQARLFEGLLSLLDSLGTDRPVLLLIEDLHWADSSTRAALAFLCRSLSSERVLLVASYRPDELHRRHPLRSLLAELERNPNARRISLPPLTLEELSGQLEDILGEPPAAELLDRLWTRSGGNPLYVEELLAAGLDGRGSAPDTLRDALMLRVERLSEAAQELLRIVAVGQRLDHAFLAETSAMEPRALRDALREAVDSHILVADEDGTHRFRHALLREVVDDDLLPGERSALHLALARAADARVAAGGESAALSAAVAHHYAAAGDQPAALAASVRAAADAERVHAHGEAAALLDRVLALWDRVPEPEAKAGIDRVAVLVRAGEATGALGDPARELSLYEAAIEALGPDAPRTRAAKVYESIARAQRALNRPKSSVTTLERALELLEGLPPDEAGTARGRLLANLARGRMLDGRFGDAVDTARRALNVCTDGGMPIAEGHARNTLGVSLAATGDVEAGAKELRRAIALAIERDHIQDMSDAYVNFADMLHLVGRTPEAREIAAEGRAAVGNRRPIAAMWLDAMAAELAFDAGDWDEAEELLPKPLRWTGTHTRMNLGLRLASFSVGRGRHEDASAQLADLEELAKDSSEPQYLGPLGCLTAELRRREGDLDAARAAVEQALDRIEFCTEDAMRVSAVAAVGVTVEADAAERARDLGDADEEKAALRRLDDLLARVAAAATRTRPVECALLLGARAEAGRAAGRPAAQDFERAAQAWDEVGRPESAARMRLRAAEALVAAGDREAAAEVASVAHASATKMGATWLKSELEGLAARARLTLDGVTEPAEQAPDDAEDSFGLTTRERQVLVLVAGGATNREIGATLYMAEKTASVHVSRILGKLNVRSRTEAAAVAHRHGLS